jgi:plastocyanin
MRSRTKCAHIAARTLGVLLLGLFAVTARADAVAVKIEKLAFATGPLSAHVGDSIEWVNADFVAHTATARNGVWDVMIPAHGIASVVLDRAGTFDYYCKFHPNMTGQITVVK